MLSAIIYSKCSYATCHVEWQLLNKWFVLPGPLVLGIKLLRFIIMVDRIRTVLQRSKPNSCTALIGEQPNPWNRFQLQDAISRHRGAKQLRRYGLLRDISLLSLAYLLSVDRYPFPQRNTGSLWPTFIPAWLVSLTVKLIYAIILNR
jgi:hypothetical protein